MLCAYLSLALRAGLLANALWWWADPAAGSPSPPSPSTKPATAGASKAAETAAPCRCLDAGTCGSTAAAERERLHRLGAQLAPRLGRPNEGTRRSRPHPRPRRASARHRAPRSTRRPRPAPGKSPVCAPQQSSAGRSSSARASPSPAPSNPGAGPYHTCCPAQCETCSP
jgi:hypothetical protein